MRTIERGAYLQGLYDELKDQLRRYVGMLSEYHNLQGRLEVSERTVKTTRDHLLNSLGEHIEGNFEDLPEDWAETLRHVRFIGTRASDAILYVLREHKHPLTSDQLLDALNECQFRFRTPTPLREINAALMRQPYIRREGDLWIYDPPKPRRTRKQEAAEDAHQEELDNTAA